MRVTWDAAKAASNERKHGVSFHEASTVLGDGLSVTIEDPNHPSTEYRFVTFGAASTGRFLVVVHADHGPVLRIISARLMTPAERRAYERNR
jgi:hypothetical protein